MAEKAQRQDRFEERIPEEVREHLRAARKEFREGIEMLLPAGFVEHRRKARREMLLALRSAIDSAIKRIDEKESETA